MTIQSVFEQLARFAPTALAQDWDNVGLLVGDPSRKVKRILISLDASANAVDFALKTKCNLIVSHHPLIFHPLRTITHPTILKMVEKKIGLISMHTNFDSAIGGVNHALADALEMEVVESLGIGESRDIGLVCSYKKSYCLSEIAQYVRQRLDASGLRLWTAGWNENREIRRIAICGGSGGSMLTLAEQKADLLITGDISYHSFLDSSIPIIDAGHFYTEYPALKILQDYLIPTGLPTSIMPQENHEWQMYMNLL
ncbi:MAG: Nif3-like dinuclear metal center hexameric protein [Candidatus Cloacimonetes bacterium]|nr:Nif3-like dinuclear metal center hexameric protein [Candidatus Cloacimonadota bacterium]